MNPLPKWLCVSDRFSKLYLDKLLAAQDINGSQHIFLIKMRTVASLENKGLLLRKPCEEDKRTCRLYLTSQATAMIADVEAVCAQTEAVLLQGFSDEEKTAFEKSLILIGEKYHFRYEDLPGRR